MRPKPINLHPLNDPTPSQQPIFWRDEKTGLVWHKSECRVLYADTDCSGAVYHSNHLRYFELGRATLMRDVNHPYIDVERAGYVYPVIRTGLNYYQTLTYDDAMWILTRPGLVERVRIRFDYAILKNGSPAVVADGFTVHCALNSRRVPVAVDPVTLETWKNFPQ